MQTNPERTPRNSHLSREKSCSKRERSKRNFLLELRGNLEEIASRTTSEQRENCNRTRDEAERNVQNYAHRSRAEVEESSLNAEGTPRKIPLTSKRKLPFKLEGSSRN